MKGSGTVQLFDARRGLSIRHFHGGVVVEARRQAERPAAKNVMSP
jgi:hypothetical protein